MLPTTRRLALAFGAGVAAVVAGGHDWLSLARHALAYDTVAAGEAANIVAIGSHFAVTRAEQGFEVLDPSGRRVALVAPPAGSESVDDLSTDGELLFVLDARPPGHLAVYSMRDSREPRLVARPQAVPVGPFSGVAASGGVAVVSGGTSRLTSWRYDDSGRLDGPVAAADLGRGQPDVLLAPQGEVAFVATHDWGPYFSLTALRTLPDDSGSLPILGALELPRAGFTAGGAKPASFPVESALLGDSVLLIAHGRGVAVVDVRSPERPRLERVIDVGGPAVNVDALGSTVAVSVAGEHPAVVLLSFAVPSGAIARRLELPPGTGPLGVALSGSQLAVATRKRGVLLFRW